MLAAITSLFGAHQNWSRLANYRRFAADLQAMRLDLYTVEAVFDGDPFSLIPGPRVLQIRLNDRQILWQKERLLNLLAAQLPPDVDGIAWVDADVLFDCQQLPQLIEQALGRVPVLQAWQYAVWLGPDGQRLPWPNGMTAVESVAANNYDREPIVVRPDRMHSGFAWAMRRETWDAIGGLYEYDLAGTADGIMAAGWLGADEANPYLAYTSGPLRMHAKSWCRRADAVIRREVGYLPIAIGHLWHGHLMSRRYRERVRCLDRYNYDPTQHVFRETAEPLTWTSTAPVELVSWWRRYLASPAA